MIRVLMADDHAIVRAGLKQFLGDCEGIAVTGEVATGEDAIAALEQNTYDVVVMDISMPGRGGLDALRAIKLRHSALPVIILSIHSEEQYASRAVAAGASAYITKRSAPDELVNAIRIVAAGGVYLGPDAARIVTGQMRRNASGNPHESLSDREFDVMRMLVRGRTVTDIAGELSLSVKTISTYRSRILEKLGFSTNADLVAYAVEYDLMADA